MQRIFRAQHPTEAHLIRGVLEANGITAVVNGESLFSIRGESPVTPDTLPSVWVDDAEASRAKAVLEEYDRTQSAPSTPAEIWICPQCGEPCETRFSECWQCGTPRPPL